LAERCRAAQAHRQSPPIAMMHPRAPAPGRGIYVLPHRSKGQRSRGHEDSRAQRVVETRALVL